MTNLGRVYEAMRDLGIDTLPLIVAKVQEGDLDLLPLMNQLTDEKAVGMAGTPQERAAFAVKWWQENKVKWMLPPMDDSKTTSTASGTPNN